MEITRQLIEIAVTGGVIAAIFLGIWLKEKVEEWRGGDDVK